jgi:hypothetical protein
MRARLTAECTDRSVPLGRYWRSSPLMLSLEPRCQGLCGSQQARVVSVSSWSAVVSDQQAERNQVGLELLLGIAIAYSAIGMASTFLMSAGAAGASWRCCTRQVPSAARSYGFVAAESLVLTLIGIILSAVVSCLILGGLYVALSGEAGSVSVILPWPLVGAIVAGCMVIAILASTLPPWFQSAHLSIPRPGQRVRSHEARGRAAGGCRGVPAARLRWCFSARVRWLP